MNESETLADVCARVSSELYSVGSAEPGGARELEVVHVWDTSKGRAKTEAEPETCKRPKVEAEDG